MVIDSSLIFWVLVGLLLLSFAFYFFRSQKEIRDRKRQIERLIVTNSIVQIMHDLRKNEVEQLERTRDELRDSKQS